MPPGYHVKPFTLDCYPLMRELFFSAYGVDVSLERFNKKYDTSTLGHEVIGCIAIHTETDLPAAFYGVFPVEIMIGNEIVLAAQSGDTMTHSDHRKKGLFIQLAQLTFEKCKEQGVKFVFGLPNENSYPGFTRKLHWQHVEDIVRYDMKLRIKTFPLPKLLLKKGFGFYLQYAKRILKRRTVSPEQFINPANTAYAKIHRNKEYLQYKNEPDKVFIELDGVVFWIKLSDVFWIGDCGNYDKMNDSLLKKLQRLAFTLGYNTISFHINSSVDIPFLKNFKKYNTEPSCFLYLDEKYTGLNLLLTGADFDTW